MHARLTWTFERLQGDEDDDDEDDSMVEEEEDEDEDEEDEEEEEEEEPGAARYSLRDRSRIAREARYSPPKEELRERERWDSQGRMSSV